MGSYHSLGQEGAGHQQERTGPRHGAVRRTGRRTKEQRVSRSRRQKTCPMPCRRCLGLVQCGARLVWPCTFFFKWTGSRLLLTFSICCASSVALPAGRAQLALCAHHYWLSSPIYHRYLSSTWGVAAPHARCARRVRQSE